MRQIKTDQNYRDILLKLIPSEIIAAYIILSGIIPEAEMKWGLLIISAAMLALVPLYLWRIQKVMAAGQLIASTLAFAVWVYSLGGPFVQWGIYKPWIGSAALILWTVVIPLFFRKNNK